MAYTRLLGGTTDTRVTDNTNSESGSETGNTDRETGTKIDEAPEMAVSCVPHAPCKTKNTE